MSYQLLQCEAHTRKGFHRTKPIRSDHGVHDNQSSFHLAHQSLTYRLVSPYEAQLFESLTYQRAQTAAAKELIARKIELMDEKYALGEKLEG